MAILRQEPPNEGVECSLGRHKSQLLTNSWLSINNWCSANNNCDRPPCSLPHTLPHISESMFITTSMDNHNDEKRREQNLFVCSSKYEAEDCARPIVLLKLTNDRHEALHGLSATAGLLALVKEHIFEFNQNFFKSQTMHFNATCTESKSEGTRKVEYAYHF